MSTNLIKLADHQPTTYIEGHLIVERTGDRVTARLVLDYQDGRPVDLLLALGEFMEIIENAPDTVAISTKFPGALPGATRFPEQ